MNNNTTQKKQVETEKNRQHNTTTLTFTHKAVLVTGRPPLLLNEAWTAGLTLSTTGVVLAPAL